MESREKRWEAGARWVWRAPKCAAPDVFPRARSGLTLPGQVPCSRIASIIRRQRRLISWPLRIKIKSVAVMDNVMAQSGQGWPVWFFLPCNETRGGGQPRNGPAEGRNKRPPKEHCARSTAGSVARGHDTHGTSVQLPRRSLVLVIGRARGGLQCAGVRPSCKLRPNQGRHRLRRLHLGVKYSKYRRGPGFPTAASGA
ncbi:hypothetical protein LZ30DRAFT_234199 [Colletotrichum cereale]|nr:hypothetical protein LZ30DRAFT_234199 [Colletotrichum cereale]